MLSRNLQIVTALDFIGSAPSREDKALELAYEVIEHLKTDDLVYKKKVRVLEYLYYIYIYRYSNTGDAWPYRHPPVERSR